jgi:hypothetical protein
MPKFPQIQHKKEYILEKEPKKDFHLAVTFCTPFQQTVVSVWQQWVQALHLFNN